GPHLLAGGTPGAREGGDVARGGLRGRAAERDARVGGGGDPARSPRRRSGDPWVPRRESARRALRSGANARARRYDLREGVSGRLTGWLQFTCSGRKRISRDPPGVCGIVGIFGHPEAAKLSYLGLYALQHRGQESGGIVTAEGRTLTRRGGMGHVADIFSRDVLDQLPGSLAIGHVRYSTAGDSNPANAQPLLLQHHRGPIAVAHNGNLVDGAELRSELESDGAIFQTTTDTEVLLHLIARSRAGDVVDAIVDAVR